MHERERDVRILAKDTPFQGYFRIDRYRLRHRLHRGGWSEEMSREVFERGHAVALLPYDPARDAVVLVEQFRPGAYAAGEAGWLLEGVAGIIDDGEGLEEVARREAVEEAGCEPTDLVHVSTMFNSPGGASQTTALFVGRVDADGLGGVHGLAEEHEDIRVAVVPFAKVMEMVGTGELRDASTLVMVLWLALNREDLRARWFAP